MLRSNGAQILLFFQRVSPCVLTGADVKADQGLLAPNAVELG
jgi:hypothetical protein